MNFKECNRRSTKIFNAKIIVIGLGGVGTPLTYMCRAGISSINTTMITLHYQICIDNNVFP